MMTFNTADIKHDVYDRLRPRTLGNMGDWQSRHLAAVDSPRGREVAIVQGFASLVAFVKAHEDEGSHVGEDGYGYDYFVDMCKGLRAMLNFECGRLDCGTVDAAILQLARDAKCDDVDGW